MNFAKNTYLRITLSFSVTIVIFIFIYNINKIHIIDIIDSIGKANFIIIFIALIMSIIKNFIIGSYRWKSILKILGYNINWLNLLFIALGSEFVVSLLPLKSGELTKTLYLNRLHNIPYSKSTFSILCEYLLDISMLIIFIFIGSVIYLGRNINLGISRQIILIGPFFFHLTRKPKEVVNIQKRFLNRIFAKSIIFSKEFVKLLKDFRILSYTFLFMGLELFIVYLLAESLGLHIPIYSILIFMPLVKLVANLPITVAGLGTREGAMLFFFIKFASAESLLSLGLLYFFIEILFPMIVGISWTGLFLDKIIRKDLKS